MMQNNTETTDPIAHEKRKRLILKIAVGVMTVVLICFWSLALRGRFVAFTQNDQSTAQFVDNMKKQWQEARVKTEANASEQAEAKKQIKETLTKIIVAGASSTAEEVIDATTATSTQQ